MGFEMLMDVLALKAKKNGVDLIVMENALDITQHNNSDSCQVTNQSDINASKRIQRCTRNCCILYQIILRF